MKVCAIVTEYNPFHLGHQFQIEEIKRQLDIDIIIVAMSGNFVQRGEPAIFDKWTRAHLALIGGVDIVIELPTLFAVSSAETFAYGAVELLNTLGVVDYLCFGSESGDLGPIQKIADFLYEEPANFKNAIKSELKQGLSFPKARSNALKSTFHGDSSILKSSNNILGVEYIKALKCLHSSIQPYTILREGASYLNQSIHQVLPSATAIRKAFNESGNDYNTQLLHLTHALPQNIITHLTTNVELTPIFMYQLYPIFKYLLESATESTIDLIYDFPIELFNRLKKLIQHTSDYDSFIDEALTKNYTKTTIQRSLIHLYLNIKTSDIELLKLEGNGYIRILGFKKSAKDAMHLIKLHASTPLITNFKDHQIGLSSYYQYLLLSELKYTNLYHQLITNTYSIYKKNDYRQPIIVY